MSDSLPFLPALRHLGDLADKLPTVIIDTREQYPLPIRRLPFIRRGLYTGDYSIAGLEPIFSVERKSIADIVSCCTDSNRERFEHELHRLRGFRFRRLLIVGKRSDIETKKYRSNIPPASVLGTLAALEVRYEIAIVWGETPERSAKIVEVWAWYFAREYVEAINDLFRGTKCKPDTEELAEWRKSYSNKT